MFLFNHCTQKYQRHATRKCTGDKHDVVMMLLFDDHDIFIINLINTFELTEF